jgi:hypothetical protein
MRTSHAVFAAVLAVNLVPTARASDVNADLKGVSLVRIVSDNAGGRFQVTVTPPPDRAVDPRFMEDFEITVSADAAAYNSRPGIGVAAEATSKVDADPDEEPVDVSGYRVSVEPLSLQGCSSKVAIAKSKPTNLVKGATAFFEVKGAASMTVTAFPTSGDVDASILINNSQTCGSSKKGKGTLDVVTCVNQLCNPNQDTLRGVISNPTSTTAKFVGVIDATISN